jgi:endoglucanase
VTETPSVPLKTHGTKIRDADGEDVTLSCANWYGAQLETYVPEGLDKAPIDFISKTIATLGFNCVRLPFSLELYLENPTVTEETVAANENLVGWSGMLVFDKVIENLTDNGLMVILNNHMSDAGKCCSTNDGNGMWYNDNYPEDKFFETWREMAGRYLKNPMVVGFDLRNEPRPDENSGMMPTWGSGLEINDWKLAA